MQLEAQVCMPCLNFPCSQSSQANPVKGYITKVSHTGRLQYPVVLNCRDSYFVNLEMSSWKQLSTLLYITKSLNESIAETPKLLQKSKIVWASANK